MLQVEKKNGDPEILCHLSGPTPPGMMVDLESELGALNVSLDHLEGQVNSLSISLHLASIQSPIITSKKIPGHTITYTQNCFPNYTRMY